MGRFQNARMGELSGELTCLVRVSEWAQGSHFVGRGARPHSADPALTSGDSLPRVELYDHLPALLTTFEEQLREAPSSSAAPGAAQKYAAAHGLQRWRQGYDLREVTRELGKLNETVVAELDAYTVANPQISNAAIAGARRALGWAVQHRDRGKASVSIFSCQQQEAAGHANDLESALLEIRTLEHKRADLWRQAAHDLRGNLGVVANATVGLTHTNLKETSRDSFVRILMRNVTSLHHLLDDVTSLARLQAGREIRSIEPPRYLAHHAAAYAKGSGRWRSSVTCFFVATVLKVMRRMEDAVMKIRRIAQNLVLNAVKFTREGGITVNWGDSDANDTQRWQLLIKR